MKRKYETADYRGKYIQCIVAAVCIAGVCFSLMLAPVVNYSAEEGSRASGICLSIATWIFVLSAAVLVQRTWSFAAYFAMRDHGSAGKRYRRSRIGIITFAANVEGCIAEIVFAAGVIVWILRAAGVIEFAGPLRMLQYSLAFSGLLLHCLFNGKNYIYIKQKAKTDKKRGTHL